MSMSNFVPPSALPQEEEKETITVDVTVTEAKKEEVKPVPAPTPEEKKEPEAKKHLTREEKAKLIQEKVEKQLTPAISFEELKKAYYEKVVPAITAKYEVNIDDEIKVEDQEKEVDKIPAWRRKQMAEMEYTIGRLEKSKLADGVKGDNLLGLYAEITDTIYKSYWLRFEFRLKNSVMYQSMHDVIKDIPKEKLHEAKEEYHLFKDSPAYGMEKRVKTAVLNKNDLWKTVKANGRVVGFNEKMKDVVKDQLHRENIELAKPKKEGQKGHYVDMTDEKHYPDFHRVSYFSRFNIFKKAPAPQAPVAEEKVDAKLEQTHQNRRRRNK